MPKIPPRHSYSRLATFSEICQRRYYFDALFPEEEESRALAVGSQIHALLENRLKGGKGWPPGPLAQDVLVEYLDRCDPILDALKPTKPRAEEWFRTIRKLTIVGKIDVIAEVAPIHDGQGFFTGVEEGRTVWDWKTTSRPSNIKSLQEASNSLQLATYCLAAGCTRAAYVYLLPSGAPRVVTARFSAEELDKAYRWLENTVHLLDKKWKNNSAPEEWSLARYGHPLCCERWCRHWGRCFGAGDGKVAERTAHERD